MTRLSDLPARVAAIAPAIVWDGKAGDFAVAPLTDPVNPGGLVADPAILSAITILVFTDSEGSPDPLAPDDLDCRGWPGDGFDIDVAAGEGLIGSVTVTAIAYPAERRIDRMFDIRRRDGSVFYSGPFAGLWKGLA